MAKSKSTVSVEEVVEAFGVVQTFLEENGVEFDADVEDAEEEDEGEVEFTATQKDVDKATKKGIVALRELAAENGIEATKKAEILEAFEDALNGDVEDDDGDEDDDEEEGYDEDELREKSLKELRLFAKSDEGGAHSAADVKGLDQDELVALIMGEDEEDGDEDEEDEDEEDEDDEEEETTELDEDALKAMSNADLLKLAKELELKVPAKVKKDKGKSQKKALVDLILESGEEE